MGESSDPFVIENEAGRGPYLIVVDHASNHLPAPWSDLGVGPDAMETHIAWDPGALGVARRMAETLDAPLFRATVSRLVLDLNRPLSSATLIPEVSETTAIPGNRTLSADDRAARVAAVYEPYHSALEALLERHTAACAARGAADVAVVAVHTFTPVYKGVPRPMHVGILHGRDTRLAAPMLAALGAEPGIVAAANEPYGPADEVYWTLDRHAVSRGLPNVMIEIRNDEVRTEDAQARWADMLVGAMTRKPGAADD
ncbi:N-formylglutamate amidohydrolase [Chthonobacter rhizosphaerae]|uniref:N-formylglutamate amidohydrolase n=1 Tax=Chthonobacter rhizosphaerae TaxID=2735553 RepID=UPI0031B607F9